MAGNVFEWCRDWHGPYEPGPGRRPRAAPRPPATSPGASSGAARGSARRSSPDRPPGTGTTRPAGTPTTASASSPRSSPTPRAEVAPPAPPTRAAAPAAAAAPSGRRPAARPAGPGPGARAGLALPGLDRGRDRRRRSCCSGGRRARVGRSSFAGPTRRAAGEVRGPPGRRRVLDRLARASRPGRWSSYACRVDGMFREDRFTVADGPSGLFVYTGGTPTEVEIREVRAPDRRTDGPSPGRGIRPEPSLRAARRPVAASSFAADPPGPTPRTVPDSTTPRRLVGPSPGLLIDAPASPDRPAAGRARTGGPDPPRPRRRPGSSPRTPGPTSPGRSPAPTGRPGSSAPGPGRPTPGRSRPRPPAPPGRPLVAFGATLVEAGADPGLPASLYLDPEPLADLARSPRQGRPLRPRRSATSWPRRPLAGRPVRPDRRPVRPGPAGRPGGHQPPARRGRAGHARPGPRARAGTASGAGS